MLINWFTVVAQIVNFLILVALLKYFLYDRIIRAMAEREESIQNRLKEAKRKEQDAEEQAESFRAKQDEIEGNRREMLEKAKAAAESERKKLMENARQEVDALQEKWKAGIRKEKEGFIRDFRRLAAQEVFSIAREAFKELAEAEVEEQASAVFLKRLQQMKKKELKEVTGSLDNGDRQVVVRSGFDVSTKMRQQITRAIHERIADGIDVSYETDSELLLGIELKTKGRKLAWGLADYLENLQETAESLLDSAVGKDSDK